MEKNSMRAVNRFKMTGVNVAAIKEGYEVIVTWEAVTSYPASDNYWIWVFCKNEVFQKEAVSAKISQGRIILDSIDKTAEYTIGLSDEEDVYDEDKCKKEILLFSSYTDLKGSYDGRELKLYFQPPLDVCTGGSCRVLWGPKEKEYPGLMWQLEPVEVMRRLPIDREYLGENTFFVLELIPNISEISKGPAIRSGYFYTGLPTVLSAGTEKRKLIALVSWAYEGAEDVQLQAVLQQQDSLVYESVWADFKPTGEDNSVSWIIEDETVVDLAAGSEMYLRLRQKEKEVSWDALLEKVSLVVPINLQVQAVKGCLEATWDYTGPGGTIFEVSWGRKLVKTVEKSCSFVLDQGADLDETVLVRAVRGGFKSNFSLPKSGFLPGFYPGDLDKTMMFCKERYQETEMKIDVGCKLLLEPLTKDLTIPPLSLSTEGILTFGKGVLEETVFTQWLKLLENHKLTPEGYYRMRRLISVYATMTPETVLAVYAGLSKEKRLSILAPGMLLMVVAGQYSWQTSTKAASNGGMTQGAPLYFPIGLKNNMLSLDPYFDLLCPKWEAESQTPVKKIIYGGGMDWFRSEIRKPYMGLWVPQAFRDSSTEPSYDPSDNLVLLPGDSWEEVEAAAEQLSKNPTKPLAITPIICRNRSFLTPVIRVWVNGNPRYLSVGSSLQDLLPLLDPASIPEMDKQGILTMKRMTSKGYEKVHLSWFTGEYAFNIPLMYEDSIWLNGWET